jgi:hypothetical protein
MTIECNWAHVSQLPDTLRARYTSLIEKKLSIPKRDLKSLMNQREEENGYLDSEIRERRLHFKGDPLGNFWARISHELMVDDGLNPPTVRYSIEGGLGFRASFAAGPGGGACF